MYQTNPNASSHPSVWDLPRRPCHARERLKQLGVSKLSEVELLCLLLGTGSASSPIEELAQTVESVLNRAESENSPSLEELLKLKGVGLAKAATIIAALELGRRSCHWAGRPISEPEDALAHLVWMKACRRERFQILFLDSRRRLICSETISLGTLESSLVHPREVFRMAIERSASALLVAHNHPSGDPEPSIEDLRLTHRLDQAARLLGFELLDHLVVARGGWVSLRQRQADGELERELFCA